MSEEDLVKACAQFCLTWEEEHPGRIITVLVPRVQHCRDIARISIRLRKIAFIVVQVNRPSS